MHANLWTQTRPDFTFPDEEAVTISPLLRALRQAKAEGKLAEVQEELEKEFEQLKKQTAPRIIINTPSSTILINFSLPPVMKSSIGKNKRNILWQEKK